ncbi:hypothetical protein AVEN_256492-1 [Araneus ventricosus]|uniref:Uncharacterized protein n=1 Tax=Araneus ventricosus TaxID=182803 RepID=A0A4Y2WZD1_ARAVE|nr:hypothetical protein AVEN_256492-1 [Araneus ventricosus]
MQVKTLFSAKAWSVMHYVPCHGIICVVPPGRECISDGWRKRKTSDRLNLHSRVRHFYPYTEKCFFRLADTNLEYAGKTFLFVMDRAFLYLYILAANSLCDSPMLSGWWKPVLNMKEKNLFLTLD